MNIKTNIKDLSLEELNDYMISIGEKGYRATQVYEGIYKDFESFSKITNLPKSLINKIENDFYILRAGIVAKQISNLDETLKYLLVFEDNNAVECVLMQYEHGLTACISTQIGCKMGCSFCASTQGGFIRNLSSGEMIEEVMALSRDVGKRITNIVLMGSGEPFDNYEQVISFIRNVNNENGLNIGQRHITISTCGIVPKIYDFINEKLQCTLAISLHSSNNIVRNSIMPINNKYSIEEIIEACRKYVDVTKRRITFEYAIIKDLNDSIEDAKNLVKLLQGMLCHVNLIRVNKIKEVLYDRSTKDNIQKFKSFLESSGISVTIRRELGSDIDAACGQLRQKFLDSKEQEGI